jgi:hypothetical protein
MKKLFLSFAFGFSALFAAQAQDVAGKIYVTSECASGGIDYYFYDDNTVIGICNGCEAVPLVQWGTWKIDGEEVKYKMTKEWQGVGVGSPIPPCGSVCMYNSYTAKFTNMEEDRTASLEEFEDDYKSEDCTKVEAHFSSIPDVHQTLKIGFAGKYTEASERLLNEADLKGMSKNDLKIMRNEIFARYGYIFKTKEMADYFKKQEFYIGGMENVDAFLSEVEIKNVELIKKFENK